MRHHPLDLVRGLAALGVAAYHWILLDTGRDILSLGTFSVYLFFVLSAVAMAMVYEDSFAAGLTPDKIARFVRNRFARLAPLLILVAAVNVALWGQWERGVLTGSGLFGLALPGFVSNAMGAWSLGIEIMFYAILPGLLAMRLSRRALVIMTIVLIVAQTLYLRTIETVQPHWHYYSVFLTYAPYFAMGLLGYRIGGARSGWFALPTALGMLGIAGFSLLSGADLYRETLPHVGLMLVTGATVYCAFRTRLPPVTDGFSSLLGNCSYALYLTHPLTALVFARFGLAVYLAAAMVVAYAVFRLYEWPCREALRGKRGAGGRAAAAASAATPGRRGD